MPVLFLRRQVNQHPRCFNPHSHIGATMTGRLVTGVLTDVNPGYTHTFGRPAPELTHVGADLRARVAAYRASAGE